MGQDRWALCCSCDQQWDVFVCLMLDQVSVQQPSLPVSKFCSTALLFVTILTVYLLGQVLKLFADFFFGGGQLPGSAHQPTPHWQARLKADTFPLRQLHLFELLLIHLVLTHVSCDPIIPPWRRYENVSQGHVVVRPLKPHLELVWDAYGHFKFVVRAQKPPRCVPDSSEWTTDQLHHCLTVPSEILGRQGQLLHCRHFGISHIKRWLWLQPYAPTLVKNLLLDRHCRTFDEYVSE